MDPKDFCTNLREGLGPDYQNIILDVFRRYRIISTEPLTLRLKSEFEPASFVGINPAGPRYFYLKASVTAPADYAGNFIRFSTIRYFAEIEFLEYSKTLNTAIRADFMKLFTLYPAELRKISQRYAKYFKWEDASPIIGDRPIAGRMICLDPNFKWENLEEARRDPIDPYQYSEDDLPLLPKPFADEPPKPVITIAKEIRKQEPIKELEPEEIDFSQIEDA